MDNLTPEEKAIGQENFRAVLGSQLLRRDFLQQSVAKKLVSGGGLGPHYFGYGASVPEPVRVGIIGTGDEGSVLLGAVNPNYINVVAISDIRPYSIYRAFHGDHYSATAAKVRRGLLKVFDWKTEDEARKHVKVYGDYHELLADKNIEAVIIALPLHLHAPAAIAAMKAGKHVLTEKLMGHSVHECKEMARVAKQTEKHLATGHQRHYNVLYDHSMKIISEGLLGKLHYIRAQWHRANLPGNDSWQQPLPPGATPNEKLNSMQQTLYAWRQKLAAAKGSAVEIWTKRIAQKEAQITDAMIDASKFGYQRPQIKDAKGNLVYNGPPIEELIRWRLWNRTGGGLMVELGSHQLDAASIFISALHGGKKQHPLSVLASGCRPIFPPDRDVDDHVYCIFEFPAPGYNPKSTIDSRKKIGVTYSSINGNGFGGYGEVVHGTKGTLLLERETEALLYKGPPTGKTKLTEEEVKGEDGKPVKDKDGKPVKILALAKNTEKGDPVSAAVGTMALEGDISRGYTEQLEHWAWCIRNPAPENKPRCHPKVALADAVISLTTNLAIREQRRIKFEPAWFDPDSDETPEKVKPDLSRYS